MRQYGPVARAAAVEDPRVVLDAVAEAHLAQHLHVVLRALAQAVALQQLALGLQLGAARVELAPDLLDGALDRPLAHVVVRRRPDRDVLEVVLRRSSPVSGSNSCRRSTSSPNSVAR